MNYIEQPPWDGCNSTNSNLEYVRNLNFNPLTRARATSSINMFICLSWSIFLVIIIGFRSCSKSWQSILVKMFSFHYSHLMVVLYKVIKLQILVWWDQDGLNIWHQICLFKQHKDLAYRGDYWELCLHIPYTPPLMGSMSQWTSPFSLLTWDSCLIFGWPPHAGLCDNCARLLWNQPQHWNLAEQTKRNSQDKWEWLCWL